MEAIRSILHSSNVYVHFWVEATHTAIYTLNCTGTRIVEGSTPFELWYKEKPSMSYMRIFGTMAYVYIPKELRKKLTSKSRKGVFMGYSTTSKAYQIWNKDLQRMDEGRDVLFDKRLTEEDPSNKHSHQWLGVVEDITPTIPIIQDIPHIIQAPIPQQVGVKILVQPAPAILDIDSSPPDIDSDNVDPILDNNSSNNVVAVNDYHMEQLDD